MRTCTSALSWLASAAVLIAALAGCGDAAEDAFRGTADGPGAGAWDSDEVSCTDSSECAPGEACEGGVCQMDRCNDSAYASTAPMGKTRTFALDREIALVGDTGRVDGYESTDGGYLASVDIDAGTVVDVAGGNLDGRRPHAIAVAAQFSDQVQLDTAEGRSVLSVGIWPVALAAGDVDADGIDELLAVAQDGTLGVCRIGQGTSHPNSADAGSCALFSIPNALAVDITAADVDHDGYDEPVLLLSEDGGASTLVVWNADAETTAQQGMISWKLDFAASALAAGDLDGDGFAEVALLEDGGWSDDRLHLLSPASGAELGAPVLFADTIDVAVGDRDGDGRAELALLSPDGFEVFASNAPGTIASLFAAPFAAGTAASKVAMLDWDGDSPMGRLVAGPELVRGAAVPTALLLFPPYSSEHSAGAGTVSLGSAESAEQGASQTVSLELGLSLGFEVSALDLFEAGVTGYFKQNFESTRSAMRGYEVGQGFTMTPDAAQVGTDTAGVVVSCGCFHAYTYETDDPGGALGGSGQKVRVFVPVGGQTSLWSSKRYNAMVDALGAGPRIAVPVRIGDVSSYPRSHVTLEGQPVADADRVFPSPPTCPASDVGDSEWWLWTDEEETNEQALTTVLGMEAALGIAGVKVGATAEAGFERAYSVTLGTLARFEGMIPPVPDDPETPEDEFTLYRYSFAPMVHREHYVDSAGRDAGYYVISYSVSE